MPVARSSVIGLPSGAVSTSRENIAAPARTSPNPQCLIAAQDHRDHAAAARSPFASGYRTALRGPSKTAVTYRAGREYRAGAVKRGCCDGCKDILLSSWIVVGVAMTIGPVDVVDGAGKARRRLEWFAA